MKKILIIFCAVLMLNSVCFASAIPLEFIYINGSNNNNTTMKNWFLNGVKNLHPVIKKKIEKNPETRTLFLDDGKYTIEEKPTIFFWGDKSKEDLEFMTSRAELMKGISHYGAYLMRLFIAECFHDAIWVQKPHNMVPIITELDTVIKSAYNEGKKVVLFGYSAGSFITYQYLLSKLPYLKIDEYFQKHKMDDETMEFIKNNPKKNTCLFAFMASDTANVNALGNTYPNSNPEEFKKAYMSLDEYTDKYCIPQEALYGVVNFASPIPLFYSDLGDKDYEPNIYNKWLYQYIVENDFFWLTVNYSDDPLGFPNGVNLTNKEIQEYTTMELSDQKGFVYDYSKYSSWVTCLFAHTSYWVTKRRFATAIVKGYLEGYKFQYNESTQEELLKKDRL